MYVEWRKLHTLHFLIQKVISTGSYQLCLKPRPTNIMKTLSLRSPTNLIESNGYQIKKTSNEPVITLFKTRNTYEILVHTGGVSPLPHSDELLWWWINSPTCYQAQCKRKKTASWLLQSAVWYSPYVLPLWVNWKRRLIADPLVTLIPVPSQLRTQRSFFTILT